MDKDGTNNEQQRRARAVAKATAGVRRRVRRLLARGRAGMTLIEIMVVVIIMGLIASGVGFAVFNQLKQAKVRDTQQAIEALRTAIRLYQNDHPNQCPTVEQLQSSGILERNRRTTDGWSRAFHINCEGEEVTVVSDGPDGRQGTDDDIPRNQGGGGGNNNNP